MDIYNQNSNQKLKNSFYSGEHPKNISSNNNIYNNSGNYNDLSYSFVSDCLKSKSSIPVYNKYTNSKNIDTSNILSNYLIRLKNFGYPDIGFIYLSDNIKEQEKTFNFFDYIITKELTNLNEFQTLEKNITNFKNISKKLDNELYDQKIYTNQLKDVNNKLKIENQNLKNQIKNFELMKNNIINAVEKIDNAQNMDMAKMLNRVKGTEKMIITLKEGYNASLKELNAEISELKNFIFEINNEIGFLIGNNNDNYVEWDNMQKIKYILKNNIESLKVKLGVSLNESGIDRNLNFEKFDNGNNYNKCCNSVNCEDIKRFIIANDENYDGDIIKHFNK